MRFAVSLLVALCAGFLSVAHAGVTYHEKEAAGGYNYVLYSPDSVQSPMPLIIALHSRSAAGNDLKEVDRFGTIDALRSGMRVNGYVLAPQATGDRWDAAKIMSDVDRVVATNNVDPNRIYVIGMSMGGNGAADLVAAYPDRIAAAIILAGASDGDPSAMSKVPLWVIRGLDDREEAIARTDDMVERIREVDGSRIVYSRVKGVDHRQHERILYMPYFYEWLMSHNLNDIGRPVNTTVDLTAKTIDKAYKGLKLREESAAKRKSRGPRRDGPRGPRRW